MTLARIGRFEVQRPLGSGSFATVWLARDEELDAWVAIKLLAENWSLNDDARRRFIEEARALRRLDNERIVRVYDVGSLADERPYMVMEYADRGSLEDRMRLRSHLEQPFSVREAVQQSIEIAECLSSVHDLRIVHRDVKPSNVLFRSLSRERQEAMRRDAQPVATERTLLGDFGIARRLEGVLGATMVVGSPQYMPPEQADPTQAGQADYRSDIFSATVVLYEMLTGRVPLPFLSVTDLRRAGTTGAAQPIPIGEFRPDVGPDLSRLIEQGLARDPERRPGSAWEWREALKWCLLGTAASEREQLKAKASAAGSGTAAADAAAAAGAGAGAGAGGSSRRLRASGSATRGGTLPAPTRRSTAVLPSASAPPPAEPSGPAVSIPPPPEGALPTPERRPSSAQSSQPSEPSQPLQPSQSVEAQQPPRPRVRLAGLLAVAAAVSVVAGVLLPWVSILQVRSGSTTERLGMGFRGGNFSVIGAVVLAVAGWRMRQGRRRWEAFLAAAAAFIAGLGVSAIAIYEVVAIRDSVAATFGLAVRRQGVDVSLGVGLYVVLGGGLVGLLAGYGAMRRLRRQTQVERVSAAVRSATAQRR